MEFLASNRFLLPSEVAERLRCSMRTVRRLIARGELGVVRSAGSVLVPEGELERYISERFTPARAEQRPVEPRELMDILNAAVARHRGRPRIGTVR